MTESLTCSESDPDVSVVIPCYNAEKWIGRAIESVLAQEGVTVEIIVIDDGSADGSLHVISRFADRIQFEAGPNRGACAARNRGLELAQAEYVMFLDADDYLEGAFLVSAVAALRNEGSEIAFGPIYVELGGKREKFEIGDCDDAHEVMRRFLEDGFVPPCGTVWSAQLIRSIGGWLDGLRRYQDYEITLRALASNPSITVFREGAGVSFQHLGHDRISSRTDIETTKDQARVIRLVRKYLLQNGFPEKEADDLMRRRAYKFWRQTCRQSDWRVREIGQSLYEDLGGRGHKGSLLHKIVAGIFGLPNKERVSLLVAISLKDVKKAINKFTFRFLG